MLTAGCAGSTGMTPSATMTTAIQGWEHYFTLDWTAQPRAGGQDIDGYIYNRYGADALVQILAQGLDKSGNVVGQRLARVHGTVPRLNRSYFRVAGLPAADTYRVTVWAYDFLQGNNDGWD
jgi:hypothetical protein